MVLLNLVSGYKTYIAAAGLAGLALYQASTGDYPQAFQMLMSALTAAGLRSAIAKIPATPATTPSATTPSA